MELKDKIVIGLLSAILVIVVAGIFGSNKIGAYDESFTNFTKLKATDAFTSEGTGTLSGATTLSGAVVMSNTVSVNQSTTTSLAVGGVGKTGCLAIGDSSSSTQIVYITATGSTITGSNTKPATCK